MMLFHAASFTASLGWILFTAAVTLLLPSLIRAARPSSRAWRTSISSGEGNCVQVKIYRSWGEDIQIATLNVNHEKFEDELNNALAKARERALLLTGADQAAQRELPR